MSPVSSQSIAEPKPTPKRVLVLGCTGMVGRSWLELLESLGIECTGCSRPDFDLADPESITKHVVQGYDLVVNAAAWTDVDGAEADEQGANRVNAQALAEIAQACESIDAMLISYSTDYVFSGDACEPYAIDSSIEPINAYGRSKALGESLLAQSGTEHILIRTSWVYAPWGANFVRTILSLAKSRDELRIVDDQQGRPTSAQHLAQASLDLYRNGAQGVWHVTDEEECTWFDFASELISYGQHACTPHRCTSDEYPRPAKRPSYSTLDIADTLKLIGQRGSWQTHLHEVLDAIAQDTTE